MYITPKPLWQVLGAYAISGCISFGLFWFSGDWQVPTAMAIVLLAGVAFWYPCWQTAMIGAIIFCWTPWALITAAAITRTLECEWGPEFLIMANTWFSGVATAPALVLAGTFARIFNRYFHIGVAATACTCCGYDLRGLPHDRCPECGRSASGAMEIAR